MTNELVDEGKADAADVGLSWLFTWTNRLAMAEDIPDGCLADPTNDELRWLLASELESAAPGINRGTGDMFWFLTSLRDEVGVADGETQEDERWDALSAEETGSDPPGEEQASPGPIRESLPTKPASMPVEWKVVHCAPETYMVVCEGSKVELVVPKSASKSFAGACRWEPCKG